VRPSTKIRSRRFPNLVTTDGPCPAPARITAAEVAGDHRLQLTFDDGISGVVDAAGWEWVGVFAPLKDPTYFAQVRFDDELGAISWRTVPTSRPRHFISG